MRASLVVALVGTARALTVIEQTAHKFHRPPPSQPNHVERPARLEAAAAALKTLDGVAWRRARDSEFTAVDAVSALKRVHALDHLRAVQSMSQTGGGFDSDTYVAPGSWEAMLDGTRAWVDAVALAREGRGPALALSRPAGHHATRDAAMGFGLVNFAAAAAAAALADGAGRVAVLDWDVHYGNGVAGIFRDEPRVAYASIHERDGFPRTPGQDEAATSRGTLGHFPLARGARGSDAFRGAVDAAVAFLVAHDPDVLLICAGFDALAGDPLATLDLAPADFGAAAAAVARAFPKNRVALGLEGGYDLDPDTGMPAGLARACAALMEAPPGGVS